MNLTGKLGASAGVRKAPSKIQNAKPQVRNPKNGQQFK